MELDASTLGERRDEEEDSDDHGAADTQRLVDAGVCIPRATSEVLGSKEYKLEWTKKEGRRIGIHQQVALTPFAENPPNEPNEPYYLKVTSKTYGSMIVVPMGRAISEVMHDGIWPVSYTHLTLPTILRV